MRAEETVSTRDIGKNGSGEVYEGLLWGSRNRIAGDYLRFAVKRAVEAAESYRNAALMVNGNRRDLLYVMAGMKNKQALTLKLHDPESGSSILESREGGKNGSITGYFLDVEFKPLDNIDEVFLFIFKKEHKNLDIYNKLAQLERDPEVRTLFLYLIKLQTEDIFRLESEFTRLSKTDAAEAGSALPASDRMPTMQNPFMYDYLL